MIAGSDDFADLIENHRGRVLAVAIRATQNQQDAEDAVQDALVRAWRHRGTFRGDAEFGTWLTRIVLNCAHTHRHRPSAVTSVEDDPLQAPGADVTVETDNQHRALRLAIAALSPSQRSALVKHYFLGLSCAEIGRGAGNTEGTIKVRLHRARQALREPMTPWA